MADDERRAEIEAVARAISGLRAGGGEVTVRRYSEQAIAALDHVRDARGDDEAARSLAEFQEGLTRALNRHGVPAMPSWDAAIDWLAEHGARSPQGEDHEAGIEAGVQAIIGYQNDTAQAGAMGLDRRRIAEVAIAAYLARVASGGERDG